MDKFYQKAFNETFLVIPSCLFHWTQNQIDAKNRLYDARAEIVAVNEAMSSLWQDWRGPAPFNTCCDQCDNWNGPCVCGAWHKDGV